MKTIYVIIILLLVSCCDLYSQWPNPITCPHDTMVCPWDTTILDRKVQLSFRHDQYAFVTYRVRKCNGVTEVEILDVLTYNNSGYLDTFTIEHFEFSSLRAAVELGLMTEHERDLGIEGLEQGSPPNCQDTTTFVNFYAASCGIFVNCIYDYSNRFFCSRGMDEPYPDYDSSSFKKVVYKRWQSCGSACCKKTYKICRDWSSSSNHGVTGVNTSNSIEILRIIQMNVTTTVPCTEQSKYGSKTCETTCWGHP